MSDQSTPKPIELTPYSVWSASLDNKYDDPVESWYNYFDNQREEFAAEGQYDEDTEKIIQNNFSSILVQEGL